MVVPFFYGDGETTMGTSMGRGTREDLDRYFDYSIHPAHRSLYVGDGGGEVDCHMHETFIKGLTVLEHWGTGPITIYLNTLGGDWYHGMGMYDAILACQSHVTIIVLGYAASMGSLILQAADDRILGRHSVMMIHDGEESLQGSCKAVESWAAQSKRTRHQMYQIYLDRIQEKKPRFTKRRVEDLCAHDRVFSPTEAIEIGLADRELKKSFFSF